MERARTLVDRAAVDCMLTRAVGWQWVFMENVMAFGCGSVACV